MGHFHYPDGRILGSPDDIDIQPQEGDTVAIGRHIGQVVNAAPYGRVDSRTANLPRQPQDPGFRASYRDVMIKPAEHHGVANPLPTLLVLAA